MKVTNLHFEFQKLTKHLKTRLATASAFILAADKSTDIVKLYIWVRFRNFWGYKDLLAMKSLASLCTLWISLPLLRSSSKDMNMLSPTLLMVYLQWQENTNFLFLAFHCILHQQGLYSYLSDVPHEGYGHSGQLYLNTNEPNFDALLDKLEGAYVDFVLHSEVRWLSWGKVDFWLYSLELLF